MVHIRHVRVRMAHWPVLVSMCVWFARRITSLVGVRVVDVMHVIAQRDGRCPLLAGGRHALSCLPYDVFDSDLGERRSSGRPSSVRPASVLCESQRRLLSVYG
jgi:hypothetical protein